MSLSPDTLIAAVVTAAGSVTGSVAVLKVWVKWKRDVQLASIAATEKQVQRLWEYNESQDQKIKHLESKIEELRVERTHLIAENQALKDQNEDQARQLKDITARNVALTDRVSDLEKHIAKLEKRLAELGGGKIGGAGQALT